MSDILTVKRMLAEKTQAVAEYLLPSGRKEGDEWRVGSIKGEPGKSLGVHLTGDKAGVWADFDQDRGGDLLDLWCAVRGLSLPRALDEARMFLGIERPKAYREPRKNYVRPPRPKCRVPQGRVLDYLTEDRQLPRDVIELYRIGERGDDIIFPFLLPNGGLALAKYRPAVDGADCRPTAADCEPVLFGWQAVPEDAREVTLTEGEIDAPSMAAYGYPALSVPFGGGGGAKQNWIENEFERMERFERIYLALDNDKPGQEAAEAIASRLGRHRCYRVILPRKDANDCRRDGVEQDEIDACFRNARTLDPEGLRRPSDFTDEVSQLFWPEPGTHIGYRAPYDSLGDKLLFRPAEVTLWSGATGDGKSQILMDCIVDWIDQGSRFCLSSLEMLARQSLRRACKQVSGVDRPPEGTIIHALNWLDQGLFLYEFVGKVDIDTLLDVFDYARAKYGCDQFGIDSLMRLGVAGDDYTGQEKLIFKIVEWAIAKEVHVHLVAHSRKGNKDTGIPQTEDIKGTMEIGANAFNVITVWRDRDRDDKLEQARKENDSEALEQLGAKWGVCLNVAKQRNGDFEGKTGLWFDQETYRYYSTPDQSLWQREYLKREG